MSETNLNIIDRRRKMLANKDLINRPIVDSTGYFGVKEHVIEEQTDEQKLKGLENKLELMKFESANREQQAKKEKEEIRELEKDLIKAQKENIKKLKLESIEKEKLDKIERERNHVFFTTKSTIHKNRSIELDIIINYLKTPKKDCVNEAVLTYIASTKKKLVKDGVWEQAKEDYNMKQQLKEAKKK